MNTKPFNEDSGRFPVLIDMERPEEAGDAFDKSQATEPHVFVSTTAIGSYHKFMRQACTHYLRTMLDRHGSVSRTAGVIGLNRTHMHNLMRKLGIETPNPAHRGNWDAPLQSAACTHPVNQVQSGIVAFGVDVPPFCMLCGEHLPQPKITVTVERDGETL